MQPREVKYVTMIGSAAHNYGNVIAMFQNWLIKDIFKDNNIFKTIHVQSKLAHRQMLSTPHEFLKKTKPVIVFNPRISYDEDRFLEGTLLTERRGEMYNRGAYTDLQPFFCDERNRIAIKYTLNRYVMYIDVLMVFVSPIQKINYAHFLKNVLRINIPFDINANLESYLGKDMMGYVSHLSGIPLRTEEEGIKPFLDYMNSNSAYPITYKLQGSTGTEEYYRYYPAIILTNITDFDPEGEDRQGHVVVSSQIKMTFRLEWNATGFYYLFSDEVHKLPKPTTPMDSSLIPIFTDVIMEEDLNLPPGWKLYNHASCMLQKIRDSLSIDHMVNESIKAAVGYHLEHGMPLEFIDVKVRRQGELMIPEKDFHVDFNTFTIYFNNKSYGYYTYTILISINILYINSLLKDVFHLE